jgi:hypothetical protein
MALPAEMIFGRKDAAVGGAAVIVYLKRLLADLLVVDQRQHLKPVRPRQEADDVRIGPEGVLLLMVAILVKRLTFRGFIVFDFSQQQPEFERDMTQWLRETRVKYREDVVEGLENAVAAFQGLFRGQNFGKLLVRVGPEPGKQ